MSFERLPGSFIMITGRAILLIHKFPFPHPVFWRFDQKETNIKSMGRSVGHVCWANSNKAKLFLYFLCKHFEHIKICLTSLKKTNVEKFVFLIFAFET